MPVDDRAGNRRFDRSLAPRIVSIDVARPPQERGRLAQHAEIGGRRIPGHRARSAAASRIEGRRRRSGERIPGGADAQPETHCFGLLPLPHRSLRQARLDQARDSASRVIRRQPIAVLVRRQNRRRCASWVNDHRSSMLECLSALIGSLIPTPPIRFVVAVAAVVRPCASRSNSTLASSPRMVSRNECRSRIVDAG